MTAKRWLAAFFGTCLLLLAAVAAINIATDPFGVFGDRLFHWYSYNETNNPRVAKIAYLQQHKDEYDSYFVGCSSTSSFPAETANEYWDANFYNTIMYGADMLDCEQTVRWLLDNCTVKNIILNVYITNGQTYDTENDPYTYRMHEQTTGENPLLFYGRYAFANLNYAFDKLKAHGEDTYLNQSFDVFDEASGAYDKLARDTEYIGALEPYLEDYNEFVEYPHQSHGLDVIDACLDSVARIRDLCAEHDVNLTVLSAPLYWEYLQDFPAEKIKELYARLADVTPYWDFSMSSVSFEPRYFYDSTHLRNSVGDMALARIAGDDSIYIPEDFGVYVTPENARAHAESLFTVSARDPAAYTAEVPILMYHNLTDTAADEMNISPARFAEQLDALLEAGYTAVSLSDLYDYVVRGGELPEKPVVITFDDGYLSNYTEAYPALRARSMKAAIFAIGVSVGKTQYKDTAYDITPHFDWAQAQEMLASGLIEVQSHTYDMHQWPDFEDGTSVRRTAARLEGESESDYIAALRADSDAWKQAAADGGLDAPFAFAYPEGDANELAEAIWHEEGYAVTLRTERGVNTLVRGLPQSLLGLKRIGVDGGWTADELLQTIESYQ